ncbi:hypothetical protein VULLAG_LOCUS20413 [Vulpes lagopus]
MGQTAAERAPCTSQLTWTLSKAEAPKRLRRKEEAQSESGRALRRSKATEGWDLRPGFLIAQRLGPSHYWKSESLHQRAA